MGKLHLGYVNIFVSDLDRAVTFYRDTLGLDLNMADADFGTNHFHQLIAVGSITVAEKEKNGW